MIQRGQKQESLLLSCLKTRLFLCKGENMKDFISLNDYSIKEIESMIARAEYFKKTQEIPKLNKSIVNLFYENSTRTHFSFLSAQQKLGMLTMDVDPYVSSEKKGECLSDTLKTLKCLGTDCVVIRHGDTDLVKHDPQYPCLINAGIGTKEHPSQALLDLMTIKEVHGTLNGLKITMIGDLKHSRVAKSNTQVFKRFGAKLFYVAPTAYQDEYYSHYGHYISMEQALKDSDVIICLRIQKERHHEKTTLSLDDYFKHYGMDTTKLAQTQAHCMIMHPGPINRNVEMSDAVIDDKKSYYFKQIENGLYARMAILEAVCA